MPIRGKDLLDAAELLAKNKNFMVAVKFSLAGGAFVGITTTIGGLMLGPIGLAIGGLGGGILGYAASKDKFKPLHEVIANDLTHTQRAQFIQLLRNAIEDFDITDAAKLAFLLTNNLSLQAAFENSIKLFAEKELHYTLQQ